MTTAIWESPVQVPALSADNERKPASVEPLTEMSSEAVERWRQLFHADPEAYAQYLQGRYFWNKRDVASMRKGLEYFDRAIALDPSFALAHAAIAQTWAVFEVNSYVPPKQGTVQAKAAAQRALEIDPSIAEAWAALGLVAGLSDRAWQESESLLQKAIAANPSAATTYGWYGNVLTAQGKLTEAAAMLDRAEQLDPLSIAIKNTRGEVAYYARDADKILSLARAIEELDPQRDEVPSLRARAHLLRGELDQYDRAVQLMRDSVLRDYFVVGSAAVRRAHAFRAQADRLSRTPNVNAYVMAILFAWAGDRDAAFAWLDRSYATGESTLTSVAVEPAFDTLRTDPRYVALLKKMD